MMVEAQETRATIEDGIVWPSRIALYAIMALQADLNPKLIDLARDLSGGAMIMLPSSRMDYENPDALQDLENGIAWISISTAGSSAQAGMGPDR